MRWSLIQISVYTDISVKCVVLCCRFAIYVPLFVPVSLPLLLSTCAALRHLFKRKDKCVEQRTEKELDTTVDKPSTETSS